MYNNVIEILKPIRKIAYYMWQKGWIERNAGNISINLSTVINFSFEVSKNEKVQYSGIPTGSAGMIFFFTGKGQRLRDLINKAEEVSCILRINEDEKSYTILWGGKAKDFNVSSEFIPHMNIHIRNSVINSEKSCIVHAHPNELIALSHHPVINKDEKAFNHALACMLPEVRMFVPGGIALIEYAIPGSFELAKKTTEKIDKADVMMWLKHGVLCSDTSIIEAFDKIDVLNKAATVYLSCLSAGFVPEGIPEE